MTIELTPEIEQILMAESSATGLTPAEITLRVLKMYAQSVPLHQPEFDQPSILTADSIVLNPNISAEVLEQRRAAADRIIARRNSSKAPTLNLPKGMTLREYIHEGHRY